MNNQPRNAASSWLFAIVAIVVTVLLRDQWQPWIDGGKTPEPSGIAAIWRGHRDEALQLASALDAVLIVRKLKPDLGDLFVEQMISAMSERLADANGGKMHPAGVDAIVDALSKADKAAWPDEMAKLADQLRAVK